MIEKLIIKAALEDKQFLNLITGTFEEKYFTDSVVGEVFNRLKLHNIEYSKILPKSIILNDVENSKELFDEIDSIDFNLATNYDYLVNETNNYLK